MICELDIGNTNCKWRTVDGKGNQIAAGRAATIRCVEALQEIQPHPDRVRVASVAGNKIDSDISDWIEQNWQVSSEFAVTQKEFAGIAIAYQDPNRLGVDRWLAMLAAFKEFAGPVCVMDLGSAVTVDLLDSSGTHLGGYIVPGVQLQERVLINETGRIHMDASVIADPTAWGKSSEECISFGIRRMITAFVDSVCAELSGQGLKTTICVTGGGASLVSRGSGGSLVMVEQPDLVLDGLAIALP